MQEKAKIILKEAKILIEGISNAQDLENAQSKLLGKKSQISSLTLELKNASPTEKPQLGKLLNELKKSIFHLLEKKKNQLNLTGENEEFIDITLPSFPLTRGNLHPMTLMANRCISIFHQLGFSLEKGPEIETEFHCFDALNTPQDHPARAEQDTFYFSDGKILRTHTSSVQIRIMESQLPPLKMISAGTAYRRDEIDATHLAAFHQLEGLCVSENTNLPELKGLIDYFFKKLFGEKTEMRLRPHFFPFTEPSFEVDLKIQNKDKWIEVAGCGMVDPNVFESICQQRGDKAYDSKKISGFAFGMGIERLAMIQWGIEDIREFTTNHPKFLNQFEADSIYQETL